MKRSSNGILHRILTALATLWALSLLVFLLTRFSGDPAVLLLPADASPEELVQLRQQLGLDRSLLHQYFIYMTQAVRGDFGRSLRYGTSAMALVLERLPATMQLAAASAIVGWTLAIPLGILAGARPNTFWDRLARLVSLFGQSMPVYWLGIVLIMVVSVRFGMVPASGRGTLAHMLLPVMALSLNLMGSVTRVLRVQLQDILKQDYIRSARAKGLPMRSVLGKHALKNAGIGVVTVMGLQLGALLGGTVVTETVFAWPGLGRLVVQAIQFRDFPLVQAGVIVLASVVIVVNVVTDLLYPLLDRRVGV